MKGDDLVTRLVTAALILAGVLSSVAWGGAAVAAWVAGEHIDAELGDALAAAGALPGHIADPAEAWPQRTAEGLPGPGVYWAATTAVAFVAVGVGAVALMVWRRLQRTGTEDRDRLGVDARAWLARPRDLRTLYVRRPVPGRFVVGRFGRRLVATECRATTRPARRRSMRRRQGDTGAVALVGPSRSGKTVAAIAGILEWDGPALLSSVKADLMDATIGHRASLGEVRVYDPLGLTSAAGSGWSPLAQAGTIGGARRVARSLLEAVADDGTENLGMWKNLAEYLMAGLMWSAAQSGRDMATVVEWTLTQDRPRPDAPSEVDTVLRDLLANADPSVAMGSVQALQHLLSVWQQDERPRSSIYVTAQAALGAFADPAIAGATRVNEIDVEWLLSGDNTIFVCSPLKDQARLSPAFGGLVDDLMTQMYERANRLPGGRLERRVLVVLDEAGNQRLEQLPNYASTVAGLGVQLVTIWQSVAQVTSAYGKRAGIVLTNHLTKLFFAGLSDDDSLGYVAKVLGDEEVDARQLSGDWAALHRNHVMDMTNRVALVQAHCLRQMAPGEALMVHGTLPPAHITARHYYEDRVLKSRAALPAPESLRHRRPAPDRGSGGAARDDTGDGADTFDEREALDTFAEQRDELLSQIDLLASSDGAGDPAGEPW